MRGATNETGFTALPGGERGYQGYFGALHQEAYFWTSTESTTSSRAYVFSLHNAFDYISDRNLNKFSGHSVRCVKD
ncbi:MAG: FISUMP domain-containing protein [Candidatus Zixiibacteriota bacterium]